MKKLLLVFSCALALRANSQVQTTTANGLFYNPLIWDCLCVPASGDSLVINHDLEMNVDIYYTSGQIKINSGGSLIDDGNDFDVWIDGTGSLINNGTFDCYRLWISSGSFVNTSTTVYFDSLWNQGNVSNSGLLTVYDILNDQTGIFTNSGDFMIDNNFNNQGEFLNTSAGVIDLENDFSNCNIQTMDAMFVNDGVFCIAADMTNCLDDTLAGSGEYYIGGSSSNFGVFDGTFTFNTPSGTVGVPGNIQAGVTIGNDPCYLNLAEDRQTISVYPNPAHEQLFVSPMNMPYTISDMSGRVIISGQTMNSAIDISSLNSGVYLISVMLSDGTTSVMKFICE
ncbi:MAG: T9SS type A sorting domain-containing protein [Crocinitomicaceae bacterium]|nr:T9SS type A sorting domain-containing protein [Crocinitomicaceae bacterium]MBK8924490.1 T9SS type A sorting domain-containing protein [Crocinitomicaceae bacterium]